jgi:hypothetical protein
MAYLFGEICPILLKYLEFKKKIIRIMMDCKSKTLCKNLFRRLEILPFASQYIFSLMLLVVENKNIFIFNSKNHAKNARQSNTFHQPITTLTMYQGGAYYMGIKVSNNLPSYIKQASNKVRKFEISLKRFFYIHSFYSIQEYF